MAQRGGNPDYCDPYEDCDPDERQVWREQAIERRRDFKMAEQDAALFDEMARKAMRARREDAAILDRPPTPPPNALLPPGLVHLFESAFSTVQVPVEPYALIDTWSEAPTFCGEHFADVEEFARGGMRAELVRYCAQNGWKPVNLAKNLDEWLLFHVDFRPTDLSEPRVALAVRFHPPLVNFALVSP